MSACLESFIPNKRIVVLEDLSVKEGGWEVSLHGIIKVWDVLGFSDMTMNEDWLRYVRREGL